MSGVWNYIRASGIVCLYKQLKHVTVSANVRYPIYPWSAEGSKMALLICLRVVVSHFAAYHFKDLIIIAVSFHFRNLMQHLKGQRCVNSLPVETRFKSLIFIVYPRSVLLYFN